MIDQSKKSKVHSLLTIPQFGRNYLLNALNTSSELEFLEALHYTIDAISQELDSKKVNSSRNHFFKEP
jgi:hypothetical protein